MRKLNNTWTWIVRILSFGLVAFQLYTTGSGPFSDIIQRSVHLAFVLTLLFILKPASKKIGEKEKESGKGTVPFYDIILAALSCFSCVYLVTITDEEDGILVPDDYGTDEELFYQFRVDTNIENGGKLFLTPGETICFRDEVDFYVEQILYKYGGRYYFGNADGQGQKCPGLL